MSMHTYIVCMGSNEGSMREEYLALACNELRLHFPSLRLTPTMETPPVGFLHNTHPFLNRLGVFVSENSEACVRKILKAIEQRAGRLPEDKMHERVRLDVDLLSCDGHVLKPADWESNHVQTLLPLLNLSDL